MATLDSLRTEAAARLLGVPGPDRADAAIRVVGVLPLDHPGWSIRLEGTAIAPVEILLKPLVAGAPSLISTPHLSLSVRGQSLDPVLLAWMRRLAVRLEAATWEKVRWWIGDRFESRSLPQGEESDEQEDAQEAGPQVRTDAAAPPSDASPEGPAPKPRPKRCPGLHVSWNHPRAWSRYLADEELQPSRDGVIQFRMPNVRLEHGDLECQFVQPRGFIARSWEPIDMGRPRLRTWRQSRNARHLPDPAQAAAAGADGSTPPRPAPAGQPGRKEGAPPEFRAEYRGLYTNLLDVDVINGATPLLEDALEAIRKNADPKALFVNCTCVPQLIGDDVVHAIDQARQAAPYPILFKDQSTGPSPFDRNLAMMHEAFRAAPPVEADPAAVNLVGFQEGRDRNELQDSIQRMGVRVNRFMVPAIDPAWADGYLKARVQILYPYADWMPFYTRLFQGLDIRSVTAPAPYGYEGTLAFLEAVAGAIGSGEAATKAREQAEAFLETKWRPRVREASKHRVGILCEQSRLPRLEGFGVVWGFPLPAQLVRMGFHVAMAILPEPGPGRDLDADVARWRSEGLEVTTLDSEEAGADWLAHPDIEAVFSDYFFDDRLVRSGHIPFSLRLFEKGFEGAARSSDRLVDRCVAGAFRSRRHA